LVLLQFRKLAELETTEAGTIVDVIGVLDTVEPWAVINKKDGTETRKRLLTIRDDSGRSVEVSGAGNLAVFCWQFVVIVCGRSCRFFFVYGAVAYSPRLLPRPCQHNQH
jgi:hypothetical protein